MKQLRSGTYVPIQSEVFPFMKLPGEIRNMIYKHLFRFDVKKPVITIEYANKRGMPTRSKANRRARRETKLETVRSSVYPQTEIMATCSAIYEEASGFIVQGWGRVKFDLSSFRHTSRAHVSYLRTINPILLANLGSVVLDASILIGDRSTITRTRKFQTLQDLRVQHLIFVNTLHNHPHGLIIIKNWVHFTHTMRGCELFTLRYLISIPEPRSHIYYFHAKYWERFKGDQGVAIGGTRNVQMTFPVKKDMPELTITGRVTQEVEVFAIRNNFPVGR